MRRRSARHEISLALRKRGEEINDLSGAVGEAR